MTNSSLDQLPMWVVTKNPSDYPDYYVARKNIWNEETDTYVPTEEMVLRKTYEDMWQVMTEMGLTFLPRYEQDETIIVGVFL